MIRFHLERDKDGIKNACVADGVMLGNNKVVIGWLGEYRSVAVYDSMAEAVAVHGHGGATKFVFDEEVCPHCGHLWNAHWGDGCGACMHAVILPGTGAGTCQCVLMNRLGTKPADKPKWVYPQAPPAQP